MPNNLTEDQQKALAELEIVEERLKNTPEQDKSIVEEQPLVEQPQRIVQLIFNDSEVPDINFAGMNSTEVLGALEAAKQVIIAKQINTKILKQTITNMITNLE